MNTPDTSTANPAVAVSLDPQTPSWKPDPSSRHELRYWDGTIWTDHVADLGVQSRDALPRPTKSGGRNGRLLAAGVVTIVEAALLLLVGLIVGALSQSTVGQVADTASGGVLTTTMLAMMVIGACLLTFGIAAVAQKAWGRIGTIAINALNVVICISGLSDQGSKSTPMFGILAFSAVCYLAYTGRPNTNPAPNAG